LLKDNNEVNKHAPLLVSSHKKFELMLTNARKPIAVPVQYIS